MTFKPTFALQGPKEGHEDNDLSFGAHGPIENNNSEIDPVAPKPTN